MHFLRGRLLESVDWYVAVGCVFALSWVSAEWMCVVSRWGSLLPGLMTSLAGAGVGASWTCGSAVVGWNSDLRPLAENKLKQT